MTSPPLPRLALALLLAASGAACKKSNPSGTVCELPPPQASALPTLPVVAGPGQSQAIHRGVKAPGQTVTFEVPAGTASVTIVEQGASTTMPLTIIAGTQQYDNTAVPLYVQAAGTQIFNDVGMPPDNVFRVVNGLTVLDPLSGPSPPPVYFFSSGPWTGALTMPNTSIPIPGTAVGAGVPAGTWTVTVGDWDYECRNFPTLGCGATTFSSSSLYDVTAILKPASAPASALQVVFYLVTNSGINAGNASTNLDLIRLQWALGQILLQAGITPTFAYQDVSAAARAAYATGVDASSASICGAFGELLGLAQPGNQLNVFLVDLIKDTTLSGTVYTTVGLDPIVPGPASFGGTPASGVLVSLENLGKIRSGSAGCVQNQLSIGTCGDDVTAAVVAHEAGHFMGLYHDTEHYGNVVDPIADTETCFCPVCKPAADPGQCQGLGATDPHVASPYQVLVTDCLGTTPGCGGGDNLMFWLLDTDSKGILTAGQASVMRASPLVE